MDDKFETITLAGGCFWCTEAVFDEVKGVLDVVPGYAGGHVANPSYRDVCTGTTGHAEAVQVRYNPSDITTREVLEIFFATHDPTTLNRQGADAGPQYRSAIFYHTPHQKEAAEQIIRDLTAAGVYRDPIVTEVTPLANFYCAEEYHRDYYLRNRSQPYCAVVINPKMAKFRKRFAERTKAHL